MKRHCPLVVTVMKNVSRLSSGASCSQGFALRRTTFNHSGDITSSTCVMNTMSVQRRQFISNPFAKQVKRVEVNEQVYDKSRTHFTGKMFGVSMDKISYYLKINGGVAFICFTIYLFFKGYVWLTHFSLATVGKMGFFGGFASCAVLYSLVLSMKRWYHISPNAVYNQAIALTMKNEQVQQQLGQYPRTGDFKAYCATGGLKLPLLRRIRSGSYELGDLLGTKPRKLQMMFTLKNPVNGKEGMVSCDVRKSHYGLTGTTNQFHSLSVHISDKSTGENKQHILIGRKEDVVYQGLSQF